ncbi:hypothetical protein IE077_003648 [Cardiosporidium cionae]|uniref:5'-3' exoribonuclease n=1 Tax=Cardiosporidium cionae TaxID=476202 RepID=A0ABQ7J7S9_9APIC|nr:hypothetical protein IE077_003648 [Cardiosporidium cionae]|eukprot:KAF8820042.1 hypothetical protein IE077_003648 [Cardiosporidium cionae]
MGVPSFYRWLCQRYPLIVKDANDQDEEGEAGTYPPIPKGEELDNLYLDMNGIIHPCTHPSEGDIPQSEDQMFASIVQYIDRIMAIVRPRKLLYLAIDGVAPRAKMNQQRTRRFKTVREAKIAEDCYEELKNKFIEVKKAYPKRTVRWDSNVITPGTPFMQRLALALKSYVLHRQSTSPLWLDIQVIFSDANIPGEGEHKIMQFIRSQRSLPNYNCNIRHVLYGADADLIMLGLATHEPYFYILREIVIPKQNLKCSLCDKERLALKFQFDAERYIDDFVFMCFFCGNDFLPHLPSLSVHLGSIDVLMIVYKKILPDLDDYLTKEGELIFSTTSLFISKIALLEKPHFIQENQRKERMQEQKRREQRLLNSSSPQESDPSSFLAETLNRPENTVEKFEMPYGEKKRKLDEEEDLMKKAIHSVDEGEQITLFDRVLKNIIEKRNQIEDPIDDIKLGMGDANRWRRVYYYSKFHLEDTDGLFLMPTDFCVIFLSLCLTYLLKTFTLLKLHPSLYTGGSLGKQPLCVVFLPLDIEVFSTQVSSAYFKGLCWVLQYYYQGCASWEWFYPYHYAPFASDLTKGETQVKFTPGRPFNPFEQLLAVLPPQSSHCLPRAYAEVMTSPRSPIHDFYPINFNEDPDGRKFRWQWVALLPFVDQVRLIETTLPLVSTLDKDEQYRNRVGHDVLFFHKMQHDFVANAEMQQALVEGGDTIFQLSEGTGVGGYIRFDKEKSSLNEKSVSPVDEWRPAVEGSFISSVISCTFIGAPKAKHRSGLLPNVIMPKRRLGTVDIEDPVRSKSTRLHLRLQFVNRFLGHNPGNFSHPSGHMNSSQPHRQPPYHPPNPPYEPSSPEFTRHHGSNKYFPRPAPHFQPQGSQSPKCRPPHIWKVASPSSNYDSANQQPPYQQPPYQQYPRPHPRRPLPYSDNRSKMRRPDSDYRSH